MTAACEIEMGPPPESDPPLVPQTAKAPPPPPQPTEPQAWSRDLDLESGPTRIDRQTLADGLVAAPANATYSGQHLTFESAFSDERGPSEAELARQRARERAVAAGVVPPQVAAAPVEKVSAQPLPPVGDAAAAPPERGESRLPPPPDFPPSDSSAPDSPAPDVPAVEAQSAAAEAPGDAAGEMPIETAGGDPSVAGPAATGQAVPEVEEWESRLPPPPDFPPAGSDAGGRQTAAAAPEPTASPSPAEAAAGFAAEAWDAPAGSILVQVSAVQEEAKVAEEWHRLQARYPQVLQPLRLVVEQAKLGDRGVFYRVQGGSFGTREGAVEACDVLIGQGQACFVVVR